MTATFLDRPRRKGKTPTGIGLISKYSIRTSILDYPFPWPSAWYFTVINHTYNYFIIIINYSKISNLVFTKNYKEHLFLMEYVIGYTVPQCSKPQIIVTYIDLHKSLSLHVIFSKSSINMYILYTYIGMVNSVFGIGLCIS